jgi:hypothetical protein
MVPGRREPPSNSTTTRATDCGIPSLADRRRVVWVRDSEPMWRRLPVRRYGNLVRSIVTVFVTLSDSVIRFEN